MVIREGPMKRLKKKEPKLFRPLNHCGQIHWENFLIILTGMMNLGKYNLDFNSHGKIH